MNYNLQKLNLANKYKYYADHFTGKRNDDLSGSEFDKQDRDKSTIKSRPTQEVETKVDDVVTSEEPTKKTFLVKGGGLRADKVTKPTPNELNDDQNTDDKYTPDKNLIEESNRDKSPLTPSRDKDSGKRRTRQARRPNADNSSEHLDNYILEKKSSLEEFEEIEKNISKTPEKRQFDNVSKFNESTAEKKKTKHDRLQADSKDDNKNFNKSINEGGNDRQRLAKEKQEFK